MAPIKKAEIVEMAKNNEKNVVLAIGDGANDIPMIQVSSQQVNLFIFALVLYYIFVYMYKLKIGELKYLKLLHILGSKCRSRYFWKRGSSGSICKRLFDSAVPLS